MAYLYTKIFYALKNDDKLQKLPYGVPDSIPPGMPENDGSSPNIWMIFSDLCVAAAGSFPPPVFLLSHFSLEKSFLAPITIALHLSFTSDTVLTVTP